MAGQCIKCGRIIPPGGGREPKFEREFLGEAERLAGRGLGFAEEVKARLHRAERELGADSFLNLGMHRLLTEIDEEALDVAGWAVLAAQASYAKVDDQEVAGELRLVMQQIAAYGPVVHQLVADAQALLTE